MNIPAIIGVGEGFLSDIKNGVPAIVDGYTGEIYIDPDNETLENMKKKQNDDIEKKKILLELKGKAVYKRQDTCVIMIIKD